MRKHTGTRKPYYFSTSEVRVQAHKVWHQGLPTFGWFKHDDFNKQFPDTTFSPICNPRKMMSTPKDDIRGTLPLGANPCKRCQEVTK